MKNTIIFAVVLFVGCGRGPVAESKPEFTSDAELIAWKDGPAEKFKGKVFRVKAEYEGEDDVRQHRKSAKFRLRAGDLGNKVKVAFVVEIPDSIDLQKVTYSEGVILEFTSALGETEKGNTAISLSRSP